MEEILEDIPEQSAQLTPLTSNAVENENMDYDSSQIGSSGISADFKRVNLLSEEFCKESYYQTGQIISKIGDEWVAGTCVYVLPPNLFCTAAHNLINPTTQVSASEAWIFGAKNGSSYSYRLWKVVDFELPLKYDSSSKNGFDVALVKPISIGDFGPLPNAGQGNSDDRDYIFSKNVDDAEALMDKGDVRITGYSMHENDQGFLYEAKGKLLKCKETSCGGLLMYYDVAAK